MTSVNKAIIIGNLGKDPEVRYLPNGETVCNITVATSEKWKDKQTGQPQERTEWHNVSAFGKLADIMRQYLRKGSKVYIEGQLQTRKWQDQQGNDRYTTGIKASSMTMLSARPDDTEGPVARQSPEPAHARAVEFNGDIPF